jgi:site-specific DNA recombinase
MCHKLPVAVYARVSSDHQARQRTIESQLADLRVRAEEDGLDWSQLSTFVDDGHSGESLERPALERLRDGVALAEIGAIYIHSPDRLARRYACQVWK